MALTKCLGSYGRWYRGNQGGVNVHSPTLAPMTIIRLHLSPHHVPEKSDTLRRHALRRHQQSVGDLGAESIEEQAFAVSEMALAKYVTDSQRESQDMPMELRYMRLFLLLTVAGPKLLESYVAEGRFRGEDRQRALQRAFKELILFNISRLEQGGGGDGDQEMQLEALTGIRRLVATHEPSLSSRLRAAFTPTSAFERVCLAAACVGALCLLGWGLWSVLDERAAALRLNVTQAELQSALFWQSMPEAARSANFYRLGPLYGVDCPKLSMSAFELGDGLTLRGAQATAAVQEDEPICSIHRRAILSWASARKAMRILSSARDVTEHSLLTAWLLRERAKEHSPHMPYVQACLEPAIEAAAAVPWMWPHADPRVERLSARARRLRQATRARAEADYAAIFGHGRMERFAAELSQGVCAPAPCADERLQSVYALDDFLRLLAAVKARTFRAFKRWPVFTTAGAALIPGVDMLNHALSDAERSGPRAGSLAVGYRGVTVSAARPIAAGAQIFAGEWYGTGSGEQSCAEVFFNTYGFEDTSLALCPDAETAAVGARRHDEL